MPSANATSDAVRAHFLRQGEACAALGSPFTARLCRVLAELLQQDTPPGGRVLAWPGDPGADALALRLCGGLQALSREDAVLAALYPPHEFSDADFADGLRDWLAREGARLLPWLDGPPQTNEVARSGVLIGGLMHLADGREMEVLEIGSSAGLNLHPDRQSYDFGEGRLRGEGPVRIATEWQGAAPPHDRALGIVARAGCDIAPLDPGDPAARALLRAYIWPDQPARIARFEAAVALAAAEGVRVVRQGASAFLAERLATPPAPGRLRVVMHSVMWQYMPAAEQAAAEATIRAAGARDGDALAWLRLEADDATPGGAVLLTRFPGGETVELGRGDFHGRWARWHPQG